MATLAEKSETNQLCGYVMGGTDAGDDAPALPGLTASRLAMPCSLLLATLVGIALLGLFNLLYPAALRIADKDATEGSWSAEEIGARIRESMADWPKPTGLPGLLF